MTAPPTEFADLGPLDRAREQKAWYWYDWANSAYYTTVAHGAVRAVHDRRRRAGGRLRGPGRDLRQDRQRARAAPGRRARCRST